MYKYACINNGLVENVIVIEDLTYLSNYDGIYATMIDITELAAKPGVGCTYANEEFSAPEFTLIQVS